MAKYSDWKQHKEGVIRETVYGTYRFHYGTKSMRMYPGDQPTSLIISATGKPWSPFADGHSLAEDFQ